MRMIIAMTSSTLCPRCNTRNKSFTKNGNRLSYCQQCKAQYSREWLKAHPEQYKAILERQRRKRETTTTTQIERRRKLFAQNKGHSPHLQLLYDAAFHLPDQTGCLNWPGCLSSHGYAQVNVRGKKYAAARFVLELVLGRPLRVGLETLHACNNRRCYQRGHLREGTHQANMQQATEQGRMNSPRRVASPEDVQLARQLRKERRPQAEIERRTGLSLSAQWRLHRGYTYKNVPYT